MSPKIIDKTRKRTQIARFALDLLAEKGFFRFSIAGVAKAAGIGKGTIYEYFTSRDELILAAFKVWVDEMTATVADRMKHCEDPGQRLRRMAHTTMETFMADRRTTRLSFVLFQILEAVPDFHARYDFINYTMEDVRRQVVEMLAEGADKGIFGPDARNQGEAEAVNLLAYTDGLAAHYLLSGGSLDMAAQLDRYLDNLFISLGASSDRRSS